VERRSHQGRERGSSRTNTVITLLIVGVMIFVAVEVLPPYFANYQFQDSIQSEARFALAAYPRKSLDDIRDDIWRKAQDLSIPLAQKDDIKINMDQSNVTISVNYSVPVDLKFYQFTLQFHPHADNHSI
jgi:hypothetical protein